MPAKVVRLFKRIRQIKPTAQENGRPHVVTRHIISTFSSLLITCFYSFFATLTQEVNFVSVNKYLLTSSESPLSRLVTWYGRLHSFNRHQHIMVYPQMERAIMHFTYQPESFTALW